MSTSFKEVYRLSLQLPPDERKRLAEYLLNPPPPVNAQQVIAKLNAHADILRQMGVTRIGVFGSVVQGNVDLASDIDVLVTLAEPSFRVFMQIKFALEDILGRPVDLVLEDTLREELRPTVLREVVYAEGV